ncbi:MAG: response regulator [Gaiellales bacterium]|nr:MAG: response regulator [Gaiellales bacterium]
MSTAGKILVVEDNEMNLELVSDLLEAKGFDVLQAQSGAEALLLAEAERPDLVLMDIQLPGMDGLEVTRRLKENPATNDIEVVALTAHAMLGDEERAREAGCSGYIAKPIDTRDFVLTVSRFINRD